MEEGFNHLSKRIENSGKTQFETDLSQVKNDQNKLHARIVRFEKMIWNELAEIQSEYRSGKGNLFYDINDLIFPSSNFVISQSDMLMTNRPGIQKFRWLCAIFKLLLTSHYMFSGQFQHCL